MLSCLFLVALWSPAGKGCPGSGVVLDLSIPYPYLLTYIKTLKTGSARICSLRIFIKSDHFNRAKTDDKTNNNNIELFGLEYINKSSGSLKFIFSPCMHVHVCD